MYTRKQPDRLVKHTGDGTGGAAIALAGKAREFYICEPELFTMTDIILVEYNPLWPEQFEALKAMYEKALGPLAVSIEHVGSTAVSGLAAKPIIDMDIIIADMTKLEPVVAIITVLGYEFRGDMGIPDRFAFSALTDNSRQSS